MQAPEYWNAQGPLCALGWRTGDLAMIRSAQALRVTREAPLAVDSAAAHKSPARARGQHAARFKSANGAGAILSAVQEQEGWHLPRWWNGRHVVLRGRWPTGRAGSSPVLGTNFFILGARAGAFEPRHGNK